MRPLGVTQKAVLRALVTHGSWSRARGWVWTTATATERILQGLERRGLVKSEPGPATVYGDGTKYSLTEEGLAIAKGDTI